MHYWIIIIVIAAIVASQVTIFINNWGKISLFENIFPANRSKLYLNYDDEPKKKSLKGIETHHRNDVLDVIITSLNSYLVNNRSAVSDFHLMKDIVDRNCDAAEEEIHTQIPVPLYLGLVGTMLGILVGVGFLVGGGGLKELLDSSSGSGAEGIEGLLGGVALAMISSIIGIGLTTWGSYISKNAKVNVERNKNTFLSWIQAELLPNISNNTSSALVRMTKNLSNFNETFAQNTEELRATLSRVNVSYKIQTDLMNAISQLRIGDIATANIEVYDKLKNSTNEIGVFAQYLKESNEYISTIRALSQKLDDYENRTQVIENAGNFFIKNEKWLAESMDGANLEVQAALERFKETTGNSIAAMGESLDGQILDLNNKMQLQQETLQTNIKTQDIPKLVEELRNLTHIKDGIKDFKEATNKQSSKIDELTREIRALAKVKMDGGIIKQEVTFPKEFKILMVTGISLIGAACLFFIVPLLVSWISDFINWYF